MLRRTTLNHGIISRMLICFNGLEECLGHERRPHPMSPTFLFTRSIRPAVRFCSPKCNFHTFSRLLSTHLTEYQLSKLKPHQIAPVSKIIDYLVFHNEGSFYLSREAFEGLFESIQRSVAENGGIQDSLTREQFKALIRKAKSVMSAKPVTSSHKKCVSDFLLKKISAQQGDNITYLSVNQLCDEFMQQLDLPREQIYTIVLVELRRIERKKITKEHKALVRKEVLKHAPSIDSAAPTNWESNSVVKDICDELESQIDLSRVLIYALVVAELQKESRQSLTVDQKQFIKNYLRSTISGVADSTSSSLLTERISQHLNLPKQLIQPVVSGEMKRLRSQVAISTTTRELIHDWVHSTKESNIETLCNQIEQRTDEMIPRIRLYKLIQSEIHIRDRISPTTDQLSTIRTHLSTCTDAEFDNIPALCDLMEQNVSLPRFVLYETIKKEINKIRRKSVSPEQRKMVRELLEDHPHLAEQSSVPQICDRLQGKMSIPREQLYKVVALEIQKQQRQSIGREAREQIEQSVMDKLHGKGSQNIPDLCSELEKVFPSVSRRQLYEVVRQVVLKHGMR